MPYRAIHSFQDLPASMGCDRSVMRVSPNVSPGGMKRDQRSRMVHVLSFAVAMTLMSCQQADRRDSPGEVAATLPFQRDPLPTPDPDVRLAQTQLADGRPALASRTVMPVLR